MCVTPWKALFNFVCVCVCVCVYVLCVCMHVCVHACVACVCVCAQHGGVCRVFIPFPGVSKEMPTGSTRGMQTIPKEGAFPL